MARRSLTDRHVASLPRHDRNAKGSSYTVHDIKVVGLMVDVNKAGRRYFAFRFSFRGRKHLLWLGDTVTMTVADARALAFAARADLAKGVKPTTERKRREGVPTFGEFFGETYMPRAMKKLRSWKDTHQRVTKYALPLLGDLPLTDIGSTLLQELYDTCCAKVSPGTANRILSAVAAVLSRAFRDGLLHGQNPAKGVDRLKESPGRTEYLDLQEARVFLAAVEVGKNPFGQRLPRCSSPV